MDPGNLASLDFWKIRALLSRSNIWSFIRVHQSVPRLATNGSTDANVHRMKTVFNSKFSFRHNIMGYPRDQSHQSHVYACSNAQVLSDEFLELVVNLARAIPHRSRSLLYRVAGYSNPLLCWHSSSFPEEYASTGLGVFCWLLLAWWSGALCEVKSRYRCSVGCT